jgi:hypothetical protein
MKHLTSLLLVSVLILAGFPACAAPPPTAKGGTITITVPPTTQPETAVTTTLYRSTPSDLLWHVVGTATALVPATFTITNSSYGEQFYATYSDASGNESDPSPMLINTLTLSVPQSLAIHR